MEIKVIHTSAKSMNSKETTGNTLYLNCQKTGVAKILIMSIEF